MEDCRTLSGDVVHRELATMEGDAHFKKDMESGESTIRLHKIVAMAKFLHGAEV